MKLLTIGGKKIPSWVCETHLRELYNLEDMGEFSELREVLEDGKVEWPVWCPQCLDNKHPFTHA